MAYSKYSLRYRVINHCDRNISHLGDLDISFGLLDISSNFLNIAEKLLAGR